MKEDIKNTWVNALRSGKYKQGKNLLKLETNGQYNYCCLGVLCELAVENKIIEESSIKHFLFPSPGGSHYFENGKSYLEDKVLEWSGISTNNGKFDTDKNGLPITLAKLNDDEGYTFEEIANVIEEHWQIL